MHSRDKIFEPASRLEVRNRIYPILMEATREGSVTQWTDRIVEIVRMMGYPLENINWNGTPTMVVDRVIDAALMCFGQDYENVLTEAALAYKEKTQNNFQPMDVKSELGVDYPFIYTAKDSLERQIRIPDGQIICQCDGTSRSVRACLASSVLRTAAPGKKQNRNAVRAHSDYVHTCATKGVERVGELVLKAERAPLAVEMRTSCVAETSKK
jgi:hypothetical protein